MRAVPVVADAREALRALDRPAGRRRLRRDIGRLSRAGRGAQGGVGRDRHAALRTVNGAPGDLGQAEVIGVVNDAVGGHATVICAAGSLPGDLLRLWRVDDPKAYHVEYGFSCMGYEIAAGLGVRLADPDRDVVVMVGDGSYLMMNSEIVTAVAEGLKLTIVVLDNHGFQCILALQRSVGVPDFGNELRFRDTATQSADRARTCRSTSGMHAEAMGALALLARTPDELRDALAQARGRRPDHASSSCPPSPRSG